LAQLAWDPQIDASAVMDDYYRRGFGPAAAELKAYWTLMERTRTEFMVELPNRLRAFDIPRKYTPELLAQAQSLLDRADEKLADAPEIYRRRVAFVRCGLDYTRLVVDTRRKMQKVEASKGEDAEAVAQVLASWEAAARLRETFPPAAVNWQAVFRQPENRRMMGLHPDNPLSGRTRREAETRYIE
jgi:hypothetical protein